MPTSHRAERSVDEVDRAAHVPTPLDIRQLSYGIGRRSLLDGLDLYLNPGESVAVIGPSGSGKSTLLSCILGLLRADSGKVSVSGKDMSLLRGKSLARHRARHIGMVFQFGELLPELTPLENVALAGLLAGQRRETAYLAASQLLSDLGVSGTDATTGELSGGERQRTAVARAMVNKPSLLLADEPTGSLDTATRDSVADLLFSLPRRWNCGLLVVTHDPGIAGRADRCLALTDGMLQSTRSQG